MAGASPRLQGMRLRKFDKPIAVHRKYLEELYFQKTAGRAKK
jgi:hypothetical protein